MITESLLVNNPFNPHCAIHLHGNNAAGVIFSEYLNHTESCSDTSSVVHLLASRALISSIRPPPPGNGPLPRAASGLAPAELATPTTGGVGGSSDYNNKQGLSKIFFFYEA